MCFLFICKFLSFDTCNIALFTCDESSCGPNADCVLDSNQRPQCHCRPGYSGNGYLCQPEMGASVEVNCRTNPAQCDENAECLHDDTIGSYVCNCRDGYVGSGVYCVQDPTKCQYQCGAAATCRFNQTIGGYNCECNVGYTGDGYICAPIGVFDQ